MWQVHALQLLPKSTTMPSFDKQSSTNSQGLVRFVCSIFAQLFFQSKNHNIIFHAPAYLRSWMIWDMVKAFNNHMEAVLDPSWITWLDESMVAFLKEFCPNCVYVKQKPHPFGNKYHTIACSLSKIIFRIEMVETEKDQPSEGEFACPEFEGEMPKTAALRCWLRKSIQGTNWVCLLDSGFGYMATLPELEKKGVFGTTVFKKKWVGWPCDADAKRVLHHMQQKPVGYKVVCRATSLKYPNTNLWLAAMVDSKHTSIMTSTWSTTLQAPEFCAVLAGN